MCAVGCWRHVLRRGGGAAVAAPMGDRVWREVRQWERGRERVSVCLFVTLCHLSKYSCIIVRCESLRVWVSSSLLLLRFSKTVIGPLGRHSNYWAERICFPVSEREAAVPLDERKSRLLRGSFASACFFSFEVGMSARSSAIAPVRLAADALPLATPSASRLAARNAAKPPSIFALSAAKTAAPKRKASAAPVAAARQGPDPAAPVTPLNSSQPQEESPAHGGFSPGAVGRSVAAAIAPLLAQHSAKKLKLAAAPGDLAAPKWPGELEVASQPDKLVVFEAAR